MLTFIGLDMQKLQMMLEHTVFWLKCKYPTGSISNTLSAF